ncbi:DUF4239 domain-containing protein [Agrobacterium rubi]|uniref:DUF4239 domain-containing protein n=1 Tax=Agrobacterium rubi TaxID=28099 RepID=A0AAE7UR82_9HYPH|nr:DUF4239 domain-containing protein [Agrobacterium rubi]NTE85643.1 DUF4239 domain-containing protein [Agrobacterium rubi]NTF01575.1 DUF4239 domain-containing protein [Agrobacterium rubi]NTF06698.1 DUF4239 domain-containing protein [Agrobacterium rubi]NTF18940.1 DUF4239 domain-containing protein [Agrobacterium rubi]NTF25903.1 DUF4239 domain-containing protein [Agrobacterium rubi]
MSEIWLASGVFICLLSASLGAMAISPRLSARHKDDETNAVIRLVANIFVVMTSLVFGLMINSSKNTFETVNANAHSYATNLILLDQSLRNYGIGGREARGALVDYIDKAIAQPARADDSLRGLPDPAGQAMDRLSDALVTIQPSDTYHQDLASDIRRQFQRVMEQRWTIIEQSEGVIPMPLVGILVAWLVLIFGSFGYRAPKNAIVVTSFIIAATLLAAAFYLVLDMDIPFRGFIQVSDEPLRRALAEVRQ